MSEVPLYSLGTGWGRTVSRKALTPSDSSATVLRGGKGRMIRACRGCAAGCIGGERAERGPCPSRGRCAVRISLPQHRAQTLSYAAKKFRGNEARTCGGNCAPARSAPPAQRALLRAARAR
jgi:hypothetical protein